MNVPRHFLVHLLLLGCCVLLLAPSSLAESGAVVPASNDGSAVSGYHIYDYAFGYYIDTEPYHLAGVAAFGDGFPDQSTFGLSANMKNVGVSGSGQKFAFDAVSMLTGTNDTMPLTLVTPTMTCTDANGNPLSYSGAPFFDHADGITVCGVFTLDANNKFVPLLGATIHMRLQDGDPSFDQSMTPQLRLLADIPSVYCCFGRKQDAYPPPDKPFPDGMAAQKYYFYVTCPGYVDTTSNGQLTNAVFTGANPTGYQWLGKGCAVIMFKSHPGTSTLGDNLDSGTGPVTTPPSGGAGTGGSGTGSSGGGSDPTGATDFFSSFWDKLLKFFYDADTAKTDLAALQSTSTKLFTYGPLGLPLQFKSMIDYAGSVYQHTPAHDPNYWVFPTFSTIAQLPADASSPDDIDKNQTFTPTYDPTLVQNFNKLSASNSPLDLAPYASYILFLRWIVLAFSWFSFLRAQEDRFTPELRI